MAFNAGLQQNKEVVAPRRISLVDLGALHSPIRDELLAALTRVLDTSQFILGEEVELLEQDIASYTGTKCAVACASGSDALSLALMALDIQLGDAVLTVPFTFFSTAGAISRLGARPVFVDIDASTFAMDMNRVEDALKADPRIRAIIPVHLYGGCADMEALHAIAGKRGIPIVEDAAQALGAECCGRRVGSLGDIGCFSFYPTKNLGGLGDGGMLTTNNARLAERLKALRVHGRTGAYMHDCVGINSRLDTLQAAALRVKCKYLDDWTRRRQDNANCYRKLLAATVAPVSAPAPVPFQTRHVYNQFVIRCPDRDRVQAHLKACGVGTEVYYPLPLHLQRCFADLGYQAGDFPASEKAASEVLALPVHPGVACEDVGYVCQAIQSFYVRA